MRGAELDGDEREGDLCTVLAHCSVAVINTAAPPWGCSGRR